MRDLLRTVRRRYAHVHCFHNMCTLSFRTRSGKSARGERAAHELLERRILQTAGRDMLRYAAQWQQKLSKAETLEYSRRREKKVELFMSETERKFREIKRQTAVRDERGETLREESRRQTRDDMRSMMRRWREEQEYQRRREGGR